MKPKLDIVLKIFNQFAVHSYRAMERNNSADWLKARNELEEELYTIGLGQYIDWKGDSNE